MYVFYISNNFDFTQHQHKSQMGLSFTAARSPYGEFQFQGSDYGSPNSIHKNSPGFPQPDMIKQEMIFQVRINI